jgi:hypothetical protein
MTAALALAILAVTATALLGIYEEWLVGQRFSEGASPEWVANGIRPYVRLAAALRAFALFTSLAMLLGAALTRFGVAPPTGKQPSSGK